MLPCLESFETRPLDVTTTATDARIRTCSRIRGGALVARPCACLCLRLCLGAGGRGWRPGWGSWWGPRLPRWWGRWRWGRWGRWLFLPGLGLRAGAGVGAL